MPDKAQIELTFISERVTKNTVRFQEELGDESWSGKDVAVGPLYIQKEALQSIGSPSRVKVTIEPA